MTPYSVSSGTPKSGHERKW